VNGEKKAEPAAVDPAAAQAGPARGSERPTVLVVDDKTDHREIIVAALEGAGYRMLEAGDADSALALLRQESPNLVFLDLELRGSSLDGVQVLAALKRESPTLPVVAYTAWGIPEWREKARAAGCDDYLVKPVDLAEVRAIARNYLGPTRPGGRS
jgi:CheY-like chemotaxis protein